MSIMADKLRELAEKTGSKELNQSIKKADERKANWKTKKPKTNHRQGHESRIHEDRVDTRRTQAVRENAAYKESLPKKQTQVSYKNPRKVMAQRSISANVDLSNVLPKSNTNPDDYVKNHRSNSASRLFAAEYGTTPVTAKNDSLTQQGLDKLEALKNKYDPGFKEVSKERVEKRKIAKENILQGKVQLGTGLRIKEESFAKGHIAGSLGNKEVGYA